MPERRRKGNMTEDRTVRPVSGEIMTGDTAGARPGRPAGDIIEADYVSLPGAASSPRPAAPRPAPAAAESRGMDILKSGATADGSRRGGPLFWLFGAVLVGGAFWVSGGHALVSRPDPQAIAAPAAADPRDALRIVGVESRIERSGNGRSFVLVDGEVINTGGKALPLPALDIRVTDGAGRSTRYVLGTGDRRLSPSARFPFSSRLEAPADGVGTVTVDFSTETN
jgi:hypothetical protein